MDELSLDQIKTTRDAKAAGLPVFKVLSDGAIKAYKDESGVRRFTITASSEVDDLVGDVFARKALDRLQSTAKGMTMFLNHSYNVPGDVFGAVEAAVVERKTVFNRVLGRDVECWCLTYDGIVTEVNPAAVQTHDMMMEGVVTLGASVSVLIVEKSKAASGGRRIEDALNLECSIVGLPCNPTSWVVSASKALNLSAKQEPIETGPDSQPSPPASPQESQGSVEDRAVDTQESQMNQNTDKTASKQYTFQVAKKGMFNDALEKEESSIYHLVYTILADALWSLYFQAVYYSTDIDPKQELELICDEFKVIMVERFLPKLIKEDDEGDKSAQATRPLNRLEKSAGVFALLGATGDLTQKFATVVKEGRRNSAGDQQMIEKIHELTVDLGVTCKQAGTTVDDKAAPEAGKTASQASGDSKDAALLAEQLTHTQKKLQIAEAAADKALEVAEAAATEAEQWKASSLAALAALEQYGLQPIPRNYA